MGCLSNKSAAALAPTKRKSALRANVTREEMNAVNDMAIKNGISTSDLVRSMILDAMRARKQIVVTKIDFD